jgi:hypothetical protein
MRIRTLLSSTRMAHEPKHSIFAAVRGGLLSCPEPRQRPGEHFGRRITSLSGLIREKLDFPSLSTVSLKYCRSKNPAPMDRILLEGVETAGFVVFSTFPPPPRLFWRLPASDKISAFVAEPKLHGNYKWAQRRYRS